MNPASLSTEQRANEYVHWYNFFARLGLTPRFSDDPPAVIWLPITSASGPAEVVACRKLGRDLLAFADQQEKLLGPTTVQTAPVPASQPAQRELPIGNDGELVIAQLKDQIDQLKALVQARAGGNPEPHLFTQPTPNEHPVVPVTR